jgi:hypothetical protein
MVGMPMARISRTSERCEGFGESVKLVLKSHSRRNRISEYLPQSNSCTGRHNTANENEPRRVQSNDGKSPNAPFGKGGGPKDQGIFASNRHFHKRCQGRKGNVLISAIANDGEKSKKDFSLEWK